MNRLRPIPFGPDYKDPLWRWASFLMGVATFVVLIALATWGGIVLFGWWWLVAVVLAMLFSLRSGRAWARGTPPLTTFALVDERGVEAPRRAQVRPREFGPFWWAVYSLFVRAPVALGDVVLTGFWRLVGGLWNTSGPDPQEEVRMESLDYDYASELPPPDRERF